MLALLSALLLTIPPPIPPAAIDNTLEISGTEVATRTIRTRLTILVRINGQGPFRFIVDSGADRSVVGTGVAAQLGLPDQGEVTLHGMSGTSRVRTLTIDTLQVGTNVMSHLRVPALLEANIGAQGILGIDALAEQRLMLDFERKTITVEDSSKPMRAGSDEIIVVARRRRGQLILTQLEVRGRPVLAVIDTGSEITVGNLALARQLYGTRPREARTITLTDVLGRTTVAEVAPLPDVRITSLALKNLTVAFADLPPFELFGLKDQPALLLGNDVLEAFSRVSLDFGRRRVRFQLRR